MATDIGGKIFTVLFAILVAIGCYFYYKEKNVSHGGGKKRKHYKIKHNKKRSKSKKYQL